MSLFLTPVRWAGRIGRAARHPRAVVQAGFDFARAWAIAPVHYRSDIHARSKNGRWRVSRQRLFQLRELFKLKVRFARPVFVESLRLRLAGSVIIPRYSYEGLLANLIHVLEVVHRLRPDANVYVDWVLTGNERGFRYGKIGDDVWAQLFRTLGSPPHNITFRAWLPLDYTLWGKGKDYLTGRLLQKHRQAYNSTVLKWLEVTNHRVLETVRQISEQCLNGRFCIGIHRRVDVPGVAALQRDGRAPSLESFITAVDSLSSELARQGTLDYAVFLATDDVKAVEVFKLRFGSRLIVRDNVQRTTSDAPEVHFRDWGSLSITDAEDVLIDTILLSRCNVMLHASSSVSTVASIMNPNLALVRV
jgi:hypothetical protein